MFVLSRKTRQGCPLSPLLFALSLEPLAAWIRRDPVIQGLKWSEAWEDRISLYADDILLYLASPRLSLNTVPDIFAIFGRYSGYTINWAKSLLYVLSDDPPRLPNNCLIQIAGGGFLYLGIFISADPKTRYDRNLLPPLRELKCDVAH